MIQFLLLAELLVLVATLFILWRLTTMNQAVERMTAEVTELTTVVSGAKTLLQNLSAQIRENAGDEAAMNALADALDEQNDTLAAAVAANTPAAEPAPDPEPAAVEEDEG
jgi:hypothetical protein